MMRKINLKITQNPSKMIEEEVEVVEVEEVAEEAVEEEVVEKTALIEKENTMKINMLTLMKKQGKRA